MDVSSPFTHAVRKRDFDRFFGLTSAHQRRQSSEAPPWNISRAALFDDAKSYLQMSLG